MNLNQVGLILNILGSVLIAISVFPVKANAYVADTNNKPIKPLAINHRLLSLWRARADNFRIHLYALLFFSINHYEKIYRR